MRIKNSLVYIGVLTRLMYHTDFFDAGVDISVSLYMISKIVDLP